MKVVKCSVLKIAVVTMMLSSSVYGEDPGLGFEELNKAPASGITETDEQTSSSNPKVEELQEQIKVIMQNLQFLLNPFVMTNPK